ncbi:MAG TPA: hypothetical protein VKQ34_05280 [Candidatus Saccharimonadales bacterium]|nr:hypothetical protein [Candidatus Saccharimonadales bacterium]
MATETLPHRPSTPHEGAPEIQVANTLAVNNPESKRDGKASDALLDVAAAGIVAADAPIVFEAIPWAGMQAAASLTHNPWLQAGLVTAGTLAIEGGAAWGASRLLAKETGSRVMGWVHKRLGKAGLKGTVDTNFATDTATAFVLGTPAMLTMKNGLNPARNEKQNRSLGLRTAVVTTGMGAIGNGFVAEGVQHFNYETAGMAAVVIGGLFAARSVIKNRLRRREDRIRQEAQDAEIRATVPTEPTYNLTEDQHGVIERDLVRIARQQHGHGVFAVWIDGRHPMANLIRTEEQRKLPEVDIGSLFKDYENISTFLAVVDTRRSAGDGHVIRGARTTGRQSNDTDASKDVARDGGSHMAMLRDMIADGEITGEEIEEYYRNGEVDLGRSLSVESNFKIRRAGKRFGILHMADLAHLMLYDYMTDGKRSSRAAIFAHINKQTQQSVGRTGLVVQTIAGRDDLKTPAGPTGKGRYDDNFKPVVMPNTGRTRRTLGSLLPWAPSKTFISA